MKGLTLAAFFILVFFACARNKPPSVPQLNGPISGRPGERLVFDVVSTDPEGREVAYKIVWGDTSSIDWSPFYASGQPVRREHIYVDTGVYIIRVMARDIDLKESEWSAPWTVTVRNLPPGVPEKPLGPSVCTTGVSYEFGFRASHPQNDSLWFQVDWGGVVDDWRGPVPSDSVLWINHCFDSAGIYPVAARARDSRLLMTSWSDTLIVTAVAIPGGPPTGFRIEAETDTTVRLSWEPPMEGQPNFYRLYFKELGGTGFSVVAETTGLSVEHNPHGLTGTYKIAAVFGGTIYEDSITLSTVPIQTGNLDVNELSTNNACGCGWDRQTGLAYAYLMNDTVYCRYVDWYLTDFVSGSGGPVYYAASPDTAVFDSGGMVPAGAWRTTPLVRLSDEQGPVPPAGDSAYKKAVTLTAAGVSFGLCTADGYYCVVKVTQLRISQGDIRARLWFQPVRGLRLVRH
ncbi:MAG: fibronectin type III domain-containing protein [candidate division WOR-3 bacterium]